MCFAFAFVVFFSSHSQVSIYIYFEQFDRFAKFEQKRYLYVCAYVELVSFTGLARRIIYNEKRTKKKKISFYLSNSFDSFSLALYWRNIIIMKFSYSSTPYWTNISLNVATLDILKNIHAKKKGRKEHQQQTTFNNIIRIFSIIPQFTHYPLSSHLIHNVKVYYVVQNSAKKREEISFWLKIIERQ